MKQCSPKGVCPGCPIARLSPFDVRCSLDSPFRQPFDDQSMGVSKRPIILEQSYAHICHEELLVTSNGMRSSQSGPSRSTIGLLALCSLASSITSAVNTAAPDAAYIDTVNKADVYLQELADARVVSGTVAVQKNGQLVYSNAFGWASEVSLALWKPFYLTRKPPPP